ncbi:hypothetical protein Q4595_25160, partial [Wenyingzhuangia sp. 1_MG-2023]|nr:hypothetical protein [Wenyingzhuangia sp. 1_MG-2023]
RQAAISLRADKLILMGQDDGLLEDNGETLQQLTCRSLEERLTHFHGEARHHAEAALKAVSQGVPRAHLISFQHDGALLQELFTREGKGTMISQDPYD